MPEARDQGGPGCLVHWSGRQAVAVLPERVRAPDAGRIAAQLLAVLGRGAVLLIVDMTAVRACDDMGAGALAWFCRRAAARGAEVRLVIPVPAAQCAALSGLDRLAPVFPALAAARAAPPAPSVVVPLRPGAASRGPAAPADDPRPVTGAGRGDGLGHAGHQGMRPAEFEDTLTCVTDGIFRAGLTLQAGLSQPADGLRQAAEHTLDLLDDTVRQARNAAFAGAWPAAHRPASQRDPAAAGERPAGAAHGAAPADVRAEAQALRERSASTRRQSRAARARAVQLTALSAAAHDQVAVTLAQLAAAYPDHHSADLQELSQAAARHASRLRQRARDHAQAGQPRPPGARRAPASRPCPPAGDQHPDGTLQRAVAFIQERAGDNITVDDIARAASVGVRAVQLSFRRHLRTTPVDYLRQVRLRRAHQDLITADPARSTVTEIATRWQFLSSSRFSAYYRDVYGVVPSYTLRHGEAATAAASTTSTAVPG